MPLVNVKVIEGVLSAAQKKEVITRVTDVLAAVEGENLRDKIVVILEEVKSGDWAYGGQPVTTADVKAIVARPPKQG